MDLTAVALGAMLGLALGLSALVATRRRGRSPESSVDEEAGTLEPAAVDVLTLLKSGTIVVDRHDRVTWSTSVANAYGLVRASHLAHQELLDLARRVRRDGVIREGEFDLQRGPLAAATLVVAARAAPLGPDHILILIEDRSSARRVDETRRDFVANVSHELKTPVGAISLLAEAILDATDDPAAVERFASRIQTESTRLTRLVQEIIDLSRLEMDSTLAAPLPVDLADAAHEAVERSHLEAEARDISLLQVTAPNCVVYGDRELLVTAVRNLVGNAIAYSESGTHVTVKVRPSGAFVEVAVSDEGSGISPTDQERIFERFYRVDAARSRATGGTGLGLAIVKHVCVNHGGAVTVWSQVGEGSTFTMRLPGASLPPGQPTPSLHTHPMSLHTHPMSLHTHPIAARAADQTGSDTPVGATASGLGGSTAGASDLPTARPPGPSRSEASPRRVPIGLQTRSSTARAPQIYSREAPP